MQRLHENISVEALEAPIKRERIEEFQAFWRRCFKQSDEDFRDVYTGKEAKHNRDIVYVARKDGQPAGTAHLTICKSDPSLGGLGGVLTDPEFRGMGIATRLCCMVRDDFRAWGGRALFLGTDNPVAFRVYRRCGWRKLAGANVMVLMTNGESPEGFLEGYFGKRRRVTIIGATPAVRIPMIPLIVAPHDWELLDANAGICSTRYAIQKSCMGLYPRYEMIPAGGKGAWFAACADDGRTVGLATARLRDSGECQVDGFVHENFADEWRPLMRSIMGWAEEAGEAGLLAEVSVEDEDKGALFESFGFREVGEGTGFALAERDVGSVVLQKDRSG